MSNKHAGNTLSERMATYGMIAVAIVVVGWGVWFTGQRLTSAPSGTTEWIRPLEWDGLLQGGRIIGDGGAPVTVVEFVSYPCPGCTRVQPSLRQMLASSPQDLRLILYAAPEPGDTLAEEAAVAAECAGLQGRFWEFHDSALTSPPAIAERAFAGVASGVGVADSAAFRRCVEDRATLDRVNEGRLMAEKLSVAELPALIVEGEWIRSDAVNELHQLVGAALLRVRMRRGEHAEADHDDS